MQPHTAWRGRGDILEPGAGHAPPSVDATDRKHAALSGCTPTPSSGSLRGQQWWEIQGLPPARAAYPSGGITWTMLATKKGSQVTKNMPSRMPRVRLAFKAFLLCLLARPWLSAGSTPGRGVLGTCREEGRDLSASAMNLGIILILGRAMLPLSLDPWAGWAPA